jgi:nucleoside-diphosphate-sugar epimerase
MANVLITGASGLIGSRLVLSLEPCDVVYAISRSGPVPGASHTVPVDLAKPWSIDVLPGNIDVVVHLAQSESFRQFPLQAEDVFNVNTLSTIKLLDYARHVGARQFVLASSGGVYGGGASPFSEDAPLLAGANLGFYIRTKICSELLSECYSSYFDLVSLRFFFVYGPGQRSHMLVPRLVDSIRSGRAIALRGETGLRLNPIHVEDAALAVRKAMQLRGEHKINVAGPAVLTMREMANEIGRAVGREPAFDVEPADSEYDLVADITSMRQLLFEPRIPFSEGVVSMAERAGA